MIIEFFGLPGAGKTFIAGKISQQENIKIVKISGRLEKYFFASLFILCHPIIFCRMTALIIKENKHHWKLLVHKFKFLFLNALAIEQRAYFHKDAIVDEGLFQFILALFEGKNCQFSRVNFLIDFLTKRDYMLYIVESHESTRVDRMEKRGRIPRQVFGKEYVEQWLKILPGNYRLIKELLESNFRHRIIEN